MGLPLFKGFSEKQYETYKKFSGKVEEFSTRTRVYQTPFMYDNVDVGDFYEIDACKGIEFKADTGFLTITEDRPIAGVTVVGSGCCAKGYNVVEWWEDGENIDNVDNKTVKRLRVDNLTGIHPSIWIHLLAKLKFVKGWDKGMDSPYDIVVPGEIKDDYELLKKLTLGFSENMPLAFHENSVHFAVGQSAVVTDPKTFAHLGHSFSSDADKGPTSSFPKKITIRCGCKEPEDPGTSLERYPGDYAIRLVQVHVIEDKS